MSKAPIEIRSLALALARDTDHFARVREAEKIGSDGEPFAQANAIGGCIFRLKRDLSQIYLLVLSSEVLGRTSLRTNAIADRIQWSHIERTLICRPKDNE